jgi:hypothetical protein
LRKLNNVVRASRFGIAIGVIIALSACGEAQHIATRTTPTPFPTPRGLSVDEAAALIGRTVTKSQPVLLPKAIPAGYTAQVTASADDFRVTYTSADGAARLVFVLGVAQPGMPQPDGGQWQTPYRGVSALYQIDTQSVPTSQRFIDWGEPGIASPALQVKPAYGVPYYLITDGFTEAAFWRVANSMGPAPKS